MLIYDSEYNYNGELPALPEGERIRIIFTWRYQLQFWNGKNWIYQDLALNFDKTQELAMVEELRLTGYEFSANLLEFAIHYLED